MTVAAPVILSRTLLKDFPGYLASSPDDIPDGAYEAVMGAMRSLDVSDGKVRRMLCSLGDGVLMGYAGAFRDICSENHCMEMFWDVGKRANVCFSGIYAKDISPGTRFPSRDLCSKLYAWSMMDRWEDDSEHPITLDSSEYSDYETAVPTWEKGYVDLMECYRATGCKDGLRLITHADPDLVKGFTLVRNIQDVTDPVPTARNEGFGLLKIGTGLFCVDGEFLPAYERLIRRHGPLAVSVYRIPGGKVRVVSKEDPAAGNSLPFDCLISGIGLLGKPKPLPLDMYGVLRDDLFGIDPDAEAEVSRISTTFPDGRSER